jgi:Rrf2 family nitric oxide-sensitive transcriptional repressor
MISQTVEYALRAVVVLANAPDTPQTAQTIAEAAKLPVDYLFKVMQPLARAGLVVAQRGKRGGFTLGRDPGKVTILDVINAVDPIQRIESCPLKLRSHGIRLCPLHRKLDMALATVEKAFSSTSLAELLASNDPIRPLCEMGEKLRVQTQ